MNRSLTIERGLTLAASLDECVGNGPEVVSAARSLSAFAERRIDDRGPGRMVVHTDGRSFRREVAEELADARNYLVWAMQRDGLDEGLMETLALLVAAWHALDFDADLAREAEEERAAEEELHARAEAGLPPLPETHPSAPWGFYDYELPDIRPFREAIDAVLEGFGVKPRVGVASTPSSAASPSPCPECPLGGPCIGWEKFPGGPSACADDCDGLR